MKSRASLAPLFDGRRMVESVVAGIQIPASSEFRAAITMNDDESTFEIPDYILSRLQPTLKVGFPNRQDEMEILRYHLPYAEADARHDRRVPSNLSPTQAGFFTEGWYQCAAIRAEAIATRFDPPFEPG